MRGLACSLVLGLVLVGCGNGRSSEAKAVSVALHSDDAAARLLSQLAPRLERKASALTPVTRADGGRSLRVNGRFSQAQIARVDASGALSATCVDNLEAAARVVNEP
jgi:hypothetical protein